MELDVKNIFNDAKTNKLTLIPNKITVLVGKNGYGKTSLMRGIEEWCEEHNEICVSWSDNEYGRDNGRGILGFHEDYKNLASMAFVSEGQSIMSSIRIFFIGKCVKAMNNRKPDQENIFLLMDQLDSGLDVHQINYIKKVINDTLIDDMHVKNGLDVYPIITANTYEVAIGEDCVDPITREHMCFNTLEEYTKYIDSLYTDEDEEE